MNIRPSIARRRVRGMSLVEMIITVAVVGILGGITIGTFGNVVDRGKDNIAQNLVETLNHATREFSHANWDLRFNAIEASGGDEMLVLRSLQWRAPDGASDELIPKGPFMRPDWNPSTSDSTEDWRIQWTGSAWKLLKPETAGAGIKVIFDGSDLGTVYVFPDNFTPVGSR
ncbi:MAG: prepilin-type N-terminal cleavage/methylation domain-containing protein [Verrucomicrobiae bacterium]|nr:prepilin-type N-terminal cleavage/methylation domain-containing protein [Verrucomicrobiae bacterium]